MSEKRPYCEKNGHTFEPTTSPGWFRCFLPTRYSKHGVVTQDCGELALCPGCLGHRIVGYVTLLCPDHMSCHLEDFPVVPSVVSSPKQLDTGTQLTLF